MRFVGLLSFIFGLSVNNAITSCHDYYTSSSCYDPDTTLTDNYVYCYGDKSCYQTEIEATDDIKCLGYASCSFSDGMESTGGSMLCFYTIDTWC